jgi:tRNA(Ile)-lysidine synthase
MNNIAVAISGGRDSVALLHCLANAVKNNKDFKVYAFNIHHGLDKKYSDECVEFLEKTINKWNTENNFNIELVVGKLETKPQKGQSIEQWARVERYKKLTEFAIQYKCKFVGLAHHKRDQAETVLIQAFRSGGCAGLSAMPSEIERYGVTWVRPWLYKEKEFIDSYCHDYNLDYIDDPSNDDHRYTRNRIRHVLIPVLDKHFPGVQSSLCALSRKAAKEHEFLTHAAKPILQSVMDESNNLDITKWSKLVDIEKWATLKLWLHTYFKYGAKEVLIDTLLEEIPASHKKDRKWQSSGIYITKKDMKLLSNI